MSNPEIRAGICGRYRFTRITVDENDNEVDRYQTPWMENIITDNGKDLLGQHSFADCFTHCYIGDKTSPSTPSATDTQLQNQIASTGSHSNSNNNHTSSSPYYRGIVATFHFGKGDAKGSLTEVGVGRGKTDLFSRALILDGSGNPTTLTIGQDDKLDVEYEFRVYFDESDSTGTFNMVNPGDTSATTYSYTLRWAHIKAIYANGSRDKHIAGFFNGNGSEGFLLSAYDGSIGTITGHPSGTRKSGVSNESSTDPYVPGSYKRTKTSKIPHNKGNFGSGQFDPGPGIKSIATFSFSSSFVWGSSGGFAAQIEFSPTIPKTKLDEFKITLSMSWDRYTPPSW